MKRIEVKPRDRYGRLVVAVYLERSEQKIIIHTI